MVSSDSDPGGLYTISFPQASLEALFAALQTANSRISVTKAILVGADNFVDCNGRL